MLGSRPTTHRRGASQRFRNNQLYSRFPVPAAGKSIRLLDLEALPSKTSDEHPLTGRLHVVRLVDSPKYAALSYVWGAYSSPPDLLHIQLRKDGDPQFQLPITSNCRDALRALRRQHGSITIWIDAICIDQRNDHEKSWQITLMGEIFAWARPVYVWLGPGSEASSRELKWLSNASHRLLFLDLVDYGRSVGIVARSKNTTKLLFRTAVSLAERMRERLISHLYLPHAISDWIFRRRTFREGLSRLNRTFDPEGLEDISGRDWFQRSWTFQELMLATNIVLMCGPTSLAWDKFVRGFAVCQERFETATPAQNFLKDLIEVWLEVERQEHWNGNHRHRTDLGGMSARVYQHHAKSMITEHPFLTPIFMIQTVIATFIANFITIFGITLIIGIIPAGVQHNLKRFAYIIAIISLVLGIIGAFLETFLEFWRVSFHHDGVRVTFNGVPRNIDLGIRLDGAAESVRKRGDIVLDGVIQAIRERKSTDPRDRSYALYGVLRNLGIGLTAPDYTKPTSQVYHQLLADLLRWQPKLLNLMLDVNGNPLPGSPSWVPDWSTAADRNWIDLGYIYSWTDPQEDRSPRVIEQTAGSFVMLHGNKLTVRASFHGSVDFVCDRFLRTNISSFGARDFFVPLSLISSAFSLAQWIASVTQAVPNSDSYRHIYQVVSAVLRGTHYVSANTERDIDYNGPAFENWFRVMSTVKLTVFDGDLSISMRERHEHLRTHLLSQPEFGSVLRYTADVCNDLAGRRVLFTTSDGYAGSGPEEMMEGDRVAVIAGVALPMILRETRDNTSWYYSVVGPACIHGLMGGAGLSIHEMTEIVLV
ncbi:heterokaryon incompatibility protein-domain-containing protein [Nemania abortiva]|nr:heterokaryon incompatibility protein-domain-containing protein [Nemania abortiva]